MEKYGTDGEATDANIIRRMRYKRWITKITDTHSEYVIFIAVPRQQWSQNALQCHVIRTLPVL